VPGHRELGHPKRDIAAVLITVAPTSISFSGRLVSDHGSSVFGIASGRMKSPSCRPECGAEGEPRPEQLHDSGAPEALALELHPMGRAPRHGN